MTIHLPTTSKPRSRRPCKAAGSPPSMTRWPRPPACCSARSRRSRSHAHENRRSLRPAAGHWRDAPDEIDEIVAEAMQRRRKEPWRAIPGE